MSDIVTVYATFGTAEEAERIARTLVDERIAACANLLPPIRSIYRWQGQVEQADEVALLFKTRSALGSRLIMRLAELHSYDVPAAVIWPIADALPAYVAWVVAETGG